MKKENERLAALDAEIAQAYSDFKAHKVASKPTRDKLRALKAERLELERKARKKGA